MNLLDKFKGANVLITGGLGFIGSNLAIRLVELGANVTLVDAMIADYGGNLFNIEPIADRVTVNYGDICDHHAMNWVVRDMDYVFHLAGQVSHILSMQNPYPDIEFNIKGSVVVMEAVRHFNPNAKVIFSGTRGQYGPAVSLPVDENAPTNPKSIYEISNLTAEKIIKTYNDIHGVRSVLLRLTNTYGPRAQMKHSQYGVVNWFIRQAIDNQTIKVFGDGSILRDFLFVDDCINAMLLAAVNENAVGDIFNVGIDKPDTFLDLVRLIIKIAGSGNWEYAEFTPERQAQEPGDFYSDITKIRRMLNWEPETSLEDGLRRTIEYYKKYKQHYWHS
ncbi:MAG TPA: NAD-dependent epimerase/dehydratase family protein [Aggregatilineales bacterium]|nr:NAD-dependent epimerase/dehydratase family protein [Aggregatilineales bacterium]